MILTIFNKKPFRTQVKYHFPIDSYTYKYYEHLINPEIYRIINIIGSLYHRSFGNEKSF